MEARAINRYIGTSPRKMRLVIDLIRGKRVDEALRLLHFSPKHAARTAEKVLRSAISNLQNKDEGARFEPADMIVKEAYVDGGLTMKRISPAPMGRAYRIRKRSNHVTIVVAADKKAEKPARTKSAPKPEAKSKPSKPGRGEEKADKHAPATEESKETR
jgi:large subunit ribosomal protein L22